ncbi:aminoglycoside phosphotransferase family protein [Halomonas lysinitropha]|uniref:Phosphotransferase enzyme family protein n=1 Tax=Halomonas lysinitropha TaxID=2607506 RepID=A0A5K1IBL5_9GAMM|nr:aminoglycoside phosphotransferase family protein [Halomonas lysinitropha]VVZ95749.1 Phosphotransferase enzyme family protein [Halomonas lysinitropha]
MLSGFIDRVWDAGVVGWSPAPEVRVSVNGSPSANVPCSNTRLDVQAAGLSDDGRVGFHAALQLTSGDIVRVTTDRGKPLRHSPWLYMAPETQGWLPASLAADHPEYSAIAELAGPLAFERFRPLFGKLEQVVAAVVDAPGVSPKVVRFGVPFREVASLQRFHGQVLQPAQIACPALYHELALGTRRVQVFDYFPGISLDRFGLGWEAWLPAVMDELARLQVAGQRLRGAPGRRLGGIRAVMYRLQWRTLGDALGGRAAGERGFLLWLLVVLNRLPRVLSHGDLHRKNVLVDRESGTLALIDWDRWGYLPTGFDMARLMHGLPGEDAERLAGGSRLHRLGVAGFTYLLKRQDSPGFAVSAEGQALRRRCRELAG